MCKSLIQTIRGSVVWLKDDLGDHAPIAFDDLSAAVSGTRIHDDVLDIRIILVNYRANRLLEKSRLIIRNCDDRELH